MYKCSKCKLEVIIYDEKGGVLPKPIRACNCEAPIIMDMNAPEVKGRSQFKQN